MVPCAARLAHDVEVSGPAELEREKRPVDRYGADTTSEAGIGVDPVLA
jgi:hypothetical protein